MDLESIRGFAARQAELDADIKAHEPVTDPVEILTPRQRFDALGHRIQELTTVRPGNTRWSISHDFVDEGQPTVSLELDAVYEGATYGSDAMAPSLVMLSAKWTSHRKELTTELLYPGNLRPDNPQAQRTLALLEETVGELEKELTDRSR